MSEHRTIERGLVVMGCVFWMFATALYLHYIVEGGLDSEWPFRCPISGRWKWPIVNGNTGGIDIGRAGGIKMGALESSRAARLKKVENKQIIITKNY